MQRIVFVLFLLLFSAGVAAQGHGKGHHGKGQHDGSQGHDMMMRHASPMPNLMKVVKKHADRLNLSEEQDKALADWRARHHEPMHARAAQVAEMEKALNEAAMAGRPKAELMVMNARILNVRDQIVSTKTDCRDNLRRVLTPEQYHRVLSIYADMHKGS